MTTSAANTTASEQDIVGPRVRHVYNMATARAAAVMGVARPNELAVDRCPLCAEVLSEKLRRRTARLGFQA